MIIEMKAGVVAAGVAVMGAFGAIVAQVANANGIVIEVNLLVQLVMTAVIVGIAFGTVRNRVDAMSRKFDRFGDELGDIAKQVERFAEKLDHHADEIDRLRNGGLADTPPRPRRGFGRQPSSDAEDD